MVGVNSHGTPKGEAGNTPAAAAVSAAPPLATLEADQADIADVRTILIVIGVSGSGKTTIATALAQRLDWPFKEGDELHPESDINKMHSGHPLDDRCQFLRIRAIKAMAPFLARVWCARSSA